MSLGAPVLIVPCSLGSERLTPSSFSGRLWITAEWSPICDTISQVYNLYEEHSTAHHTHTRTCTHTHTHTTYMVHAHAHTYPRTRDAHTRPSDMCMYM